MSTDVYRMIKATRLFDADYYRKQARIGLLTDPLRHFLRKGHHKGLSPSPHFWTAYYLQQYADVRNSGANPLQHYVEYGWKEGRWPNPCFDQKQFVDDHPACLQLGKLPVEHCIDLYGDARWPRDSEPDLEQEEMAPVEGLSRTAWEAWKAIFDADYYRTHYPDVAGQGVDPFLHFETVGWREDRNPRAGFDMDFAKRSLPDLAQGANALEKLVRGSAVVGPRLAEHGFTLLEPAQDAAAALGVGIHFHAFYPELVGEILPCLANFPASTVAYVTVCTEADRLFVERLARRYLADHGLPQRIEVRLTENRGRDIAPFLVGCADIWTKHDLVLHLHSKVSTHIDWGDDWRHYLIDQLAGSKPLVDAVLKAFADDPTLGFFYPENFYRIKKYLKRQNNNPRVAAFMQAFPGGKVSPDGATFAAGSMAWFRADAYRALISHVKLEQFEEERGQLDFTLAHVLERAFPLVAKAAGYAARAYATNRREPSPPPAPVPGREADFEPAAERWARDTARIARNQPVPLAPLVRRFNPRALDLHWIVPSFSRGAGGHMTIFRMVRFLETFGHRQTIWLQNAQGQHKGPAAAHRAICDWYQPLGRNVNVRFLPDDVRAIGGDAVIATDCWTVYPAVNASNVQERFYFIQDHEAEFHPAGELQLVARATYGMGLAGLCAGPWLQQKAEQYGMWARAWPLCADRETYFPVERGARVGPPKIAFYARPYTPRRAVNLGLAALELLHRQGFEFEAHLFGEDGLKEEFAFPHVKHGILSPEGLAELYRSCDIGVVFSTTNYSLVPLEMMACGLPVVELDGESTRAVFSGGEALLAPPTPAGIAESIRRLASDEALRRDQSRRAAAFLEGLDWEKSARLIEAAIIERLEMNGAKPIEPDAVCAPAVRPVRQASVFVPTYNAGKDIEPLLERLVAQVAPFRYDILMIDSGSTDGTVEKIRAYGSKGVRLHEIPNREFQHGRTRNLGIAMTEGDCVAILTQDALPADDRWLAALIGGFDRSNRVAGVIGRHLAYPQHGPFAARDLDQMFDHLASLPDIVSLERGLPSFVRPGSTQWQMLQQFYSDNNSAMSRAVWRELPYPEIDWGEDQVWCWEVLRRGFEKVYVDDARVFHSHAFEAPAQYKVSFTEGQFWAKHYGIRLVGDSEASTAIENERDRNYALKAGVSAEDLKVRLAQNGVVNAGRKDGADSIA